MSIGPRSFDVAYFEELYARDTDPWNFTSSEYERRKYAATLEVLKGRTFRSVFEVGCSIGILTRQLAPLCRSLLAIDVAEAAVFSARNNCAGLDHVNISKMQIPSEWPKGTFDLILFSEVLYFLGPDDIARSAARSLESIMPGGAVLLVNWTGETNYPCGGDEAVERFVAACGDRVIPVLSRREPLYRLDLLTRQE
jgi:SAM-dependent methyltransferase